MMNDKKTGCLFLGIVAVICIAAIVGKFFPFKMTGGKKIVTMTQYWQDEIGKPFLLPLVEEFNNQNPNIEVRLNDSSFYELEAELKNAVLEKGKKTLPDIISVDSRWLSFLAGSGLLESLDGYFQENSQAEGSMMANMNIYENAETFTVPLVSFIHVLFYNIDALQKAGIDRPPKTQEEFLAYCRTLSSVRSSPAPGIFSMALSPSNPYGIEGEIWPWIWASGFSAADQGRPFVSRPFVETLNFFNRAARENLLNPNSLEKSENDKLYDFINGRSPVMLDSISKIGYIKEEASGLSFGISTVPFPSANPAPHVFDIKTWQAGILKNSRNKDAAWLFLSFLMDRETNLNLALRVYGVPANRNAIPKIRIHDEFYEKILTILETGEGTKEPVLAANAGDLETILRDEVGSMLRNETTPDKAARAIQQKWDIVIKDK